MQTVPNASFYLHTHISHSVPQNIMEALRVEIKENKTIFKMIDL